MKHCKISKLSTHTHARAGVLPLPSGTTMLICMSLIRAQTEAMGNSERTQLEENYQGTKSPEKEGMGLKN